MFGEEEWTGGRNTVMERWRVAERAESGGVSLNTCLFSLFPIKTREEWKGSPTDFKGRNSEGKHNLCEHTHSKHADKIQRFGMKNPHTYSHDCEKRLNVNRLLLFLRRFSSHTFFSFLVTLKNFWMLNAWLDQFLIWSLQTDKCSANTCIHFW